MFPGGHGRYWDLLAQAGAAGADGKDAAAGLGTETYIHTQTAAATTWTINHNLGFRPAIELFDAGGAEFEAEVLHVSDNQAMVYLATPYAGSARCN